MIGMLGGASFSFTEPHQYQERIRPAEVQITPTARGVFRATLSQVNLNHLTLQSGWQSLPTAIRSALDGSRSSIMFHTGAAGPVFKVDSSELAPAALGMGPPAEEHFFQIPANLAWSTLTLTPATYAAARAALLDDDADDPIQATIMRPAPPALERLRALHRSVMGLNAAPHGIHPEGAKAAEQALLAAVVDCLAGDADSAVRGIGSRKSTAIMRRLYELLEANEGLPLYMMEVCVELGVSRRTLHTICVEHLGLSPHRFFSLRRMQLARQALLAADAQSATVTQIAMHLGFWELGRFAVQYKRLFGESPSVTLGRRRG